MSRPLLLVLSLLCIARLFAQGEIENVIVETYYVADANDATDTIGGGVPEGARTYRVFIDLREGCSLRAIYGADGHPLRIESTALLFNHHDRGKSYGHEVNNSALDEGTTALDSWLSLSAASNQRFGVQKSLDTDGSIVGGTNNDGGSAEIANGLLANNAAEVGIPLTERDGLLPLNGGVALPPNFLVQGDDPHRAFKDSTLESGFVSSNFRMGCATPGTQGPTVENHVLVAQVTTAGELTFELNVEVECGGTVLRFVARDTLLAPDETPNGLLVYPPACGCTDPYFLEYDPTAGCDDGSCATAIVYGCLDPAACNYSTTANFNIPELCCYGPTDCNGLDVTVVCPDVSVDEVEGAARPVRVMPNPTTGWLQLDLGTATTVALDYRVCDAVGRNVVQGQLPAGSALHFLDVGALATGLYRVVLGTPQGVRTSTFIKH